MMHEHLISRLQNISNAAMEKGDFSAAVSAVMGIYHITRGQQQQAADTETQKAITETQKAAFDLVHKLRKMDIAPPPEATSPVVVHVGDKFCGHEGQNKLPFTVQSITDEEATPRSTGYRVPGSKDVFELNGPSGLGRGITTTWRITGDELYHRWVRYE